MNRVRSNTCLLNVGIPTPTYHTRHFQQAIQEGQAIKEQVLYIEGIVIEENIILHILGGDPR